MKTVFLLIFFVELSAILNGQNLVINPSFEDTVSCPTTIGQLTNCISWTNPTQGTPDYFNVCSSGTGIPNNGFGNQPAYSGSGYSGFYAFNKPFSNVREYIQGGLAMSLLTNHYYEVSFQLSLSEGSQYATNSVGVFFSSSPISATTTLTLAYSPQVLSSNQLLSDKNTWMTIKDTFISSGGENFITIGNFFLDALSDTVFLGNSGGGNYSYYYIDDVSVIDLGLAPTNQTAFIHTDLSVYPNPNSGTIFFDFNKLEDDVYTAELFDVLGKKIFANRVNITKGIGQTYFDVNNGMYLLRIFDKDGKAVGIYRIVMNK